MMSFVVRVMSEEVEKRSNSVLENRSTFSEYVPAHVVGHARRGHGGEKAHDDGADRSQQRDEKHSASGFPYVARVARHHAGIDDVRHVIRQGEVAHGLNEQQGDRAEHDAVISLDIAEKVDH